jgi:hypothetical protein
VKKSHFLFVLILASLALLLLSSCADVSQVDKCLDPNEHTYGFWGGLWHGMIAAPAFIGSLIWDDIAVYAVNNNGGWYNFGFVLGVGGFTTGLGSKRS